MAQEAARVARRIEAAKETKQLDLSKCELSKIPDAAYFLLKDVEVEKCDLSGNALKKIPVKFCTKFPVLKEVHLQDNNLTSLPDEFICLSELNAINFSGNKFESFPNCVYESQKLSSIEARGNHITDIDVDRLQKMECLREVNLQDNPLSVETERNLREVNMFVVKTGMSDPRGRELEELE